MLDLKGRKVVIFGGGDVSLRKTEYFHHEASVLVVSRSFLPQFNELNVTCRELDVADSSADEIHDILNGSLIAVAATSVPALNNRIGTICSEMGIHFNNADGEQGDVMIPSVVRGEHYMLAISTMGASPVISKYLRIKLQDNLAGLDNMIEIQSELRSLLKDHEPDQKKRSAILREVVNDRNIWDMLEVDRERARTMVMEKYLP